MLGAHGVHRRRIGAGLALLLAAVVVSAVVLLVGPVGRMWAQEPARWEALGPADKKIDRLYTPTSGALLASGPDGLNRSDDGGVTWRTIERPAEMKVVTVSPTNHQLLYAAGPSGVFRSEDGGDNWQQVTAQGDEWIVLEISPADPSVLYGVAIMRPPIDYGSNRDLEFRVSRDSGATWQEVRTQHEHVLPGTQPCGYAVPLLQPGSVSTERVYTIEGCTGRGEDPSPWVSEDEGHTAARFPDPDPADHFLTWGANALVGGAGLKPERWYVSLFPGGIPNGNPRASRIWRTDDNGASWTTVVDADEGHLSGLPKKPIDFCTTLTYDPRHPDDIYAVFQHYERDPASPSAPAKATGAVVRMSHDAGATWTDLGGGDLSDVTRLAVGVDSRYLFAATSHGIYRLALPA